MRTTLLAIMMIFSGAAAQASFLPPTQPQQAPSLICHNADMEIPESRLSVEVSNGTEENPFPFIIVQRVNLEAQPDVLFSNTVNEQRSVRGANFFANGLEMSLMANEAGEVSGTLTVESVEGPQNYKLNCQVYYHQMPVKEAM